METNSELIDGNIIDISGTTLPPLPPLPFTDSITMELMMNKNIYNRYLEKRDNTKYLEIQEKMRKLKKNKEHIRNISNYVLDDLCHDIDNSNVQKYKYGLDIIESFERFIGRCIQHIETKHNETYRHDDNTLFSNFDDECGTGNNDEEEEDDDDEEEEEDVDGDGKGNGKKNSLSPPSKTCIPCIPSISQSFWGANIKKMN
jgi:hypothetical protein